MWQATVSARFALSIEFSTMDSTVLKLEKPQCQYRFHILYSWNFYLEKNITCCSHERKFDSTTCTNFILYMVSMATLGENLLDCNAKVVGLGKFLSSEKFSAVWYMHYLYGMIPETTCTQKLKLISTARYPQFTIALLRVTTVAPSLASHFFALEGSSSRDYAAPTLTPHHFNTLAYIISMS